MGRSVEVVVSELHSAAARLRDAGQRLQDGLSSVDLETSQLLGSGWTGDAASAFGNAWEQWHSGAGQVVRGLQTMADLLTVAGKEYAKTDQQAAGAVSSSFDGERGSAAGGVPGGGPGPTGQVATLGGGGDATAGTAEAAGQLAQQMMPSLSQAGEVAGQVPGPLAQTLAQTGQAIAGLIEQAGGDPAGAAEGDAGATDDNDEDEGEQDERGDDAPVDTTSGDDPGSGAL